MLGGSILQNGINSSTPKIRARSGVPRSRFAEAQPFFQLDGGEGEKADGDEVEPSFGAHRGGVEEAVRSRRVVVKTSCAHQVAALPASSQRLETLVIADEPRIIAQPACAERFDERDVFTDDDDGRLRMMRATGPCAPRRWPA